MQKRLCKLDAVIGTSPDKKINFARLTMGPFDTEQEAEAVCKIMQDAVNAEFAKVFGADARVKIN